MKLLKHKRTVREVKKDESQLTSSWGKPRDLKTLMRRRWSAAILRQVGRLHWLVLLPVLETSVFPPKFLKNSPQRLINKAPQQLMIAPYGAYKEYTGVHGARRASSRKSREVLERAS